VDPLVAAKGDPFFPSRARTEHGSVTPDMFTSAESCKECHAEIYAQWSGSMMAHAWEDPIYRELLRRASAATEGAVDKFCIGCHSPIGLTTGTVDAQKNEAADTGCTGVSCDACHTISSITGTGNGSFVLEPVTLDRPVKYGPRDDAFSPFHDTTHSDLQRARSSAPRATTSRIPSTGCPWSGPTTSGATVPTTRPGSTVRTVT